MFSLLHRHVSSAKSLNFSQKLLQPKRPISFLKKRRLDKVVNFSKWLLLGSGTFLLIGTTATASISLLLANNLKFQEFVSKRLSNQLSHVIGWKFNLGTEIVPNWRDCRITLKDVSVDYGDLSVPDDLVPIYEEHVSLKDNYTRFSVQLDRLDVRISLKRWLQGRGWLEEVSIDGGRGTLDKRWVRMIDDSISNSSNSSGNSGKRGWRWTSRPGDFDLDFLQLRNVHLTIIQPIGFKPYNVTILSANIPKLRPSWLFYDLLSAESAHGIFDGRSLFTLHTSCNEEGRELKHFRMLGLDVRHLNQSSSNTNAVASDDTTALSWVTRGTVDIEGFYQLPKHRRYHVHQDKQSNRSQYTNSPEFSPDTLKIFLSKMTETNNENQSLLKFWYVSKLRPRVPEPLQNLTDSLMKIPERVSDRITQRLLSSLKDVDFGGLETAEEAAEHFMKAPEDSVAFQVDFIFRNLRAKLPAEEPRATFLRPVIGYVNEHRPLIPLSCHFTLSRADFEGAWSGHESGLFGALAIGLEGAFHKLVWDPERRMQRISKIGRWTLNNYLKKLQSVN